MAVSVVLDTSAYSAFYRADIRLKPYFNGDNSLIVPLIVVGELRAGFALGNRQRDNNVLLNRFLNSPHVNTVGITDATTSIYASIFRGLHQAGRPIGTNDMWIAAIALEHNHPLLTLDTDFSHVPGLKLTPI